MTPEDTTRTGTTDMDTADPSSALPTPGLLQLMWLASPALPVGGFSYSEGLEAAVEWAGIHTEAQATDWLLDQLHLSLAQSDLPLVAAAVAAHRAGHTETLRSLNQWVLQTRESSEFRLQTVQMGRSLTEWLRNLRPQAATELDAFVPTWPVAFAVAASGIAANITDICSAFAFGWAENMTQTAIKTVPLGQNAGQRILARLAQDIPAAVAHALSLGPDDRQAYAPRLAVLSARHEHQYTRLFRS
jgi:urease accessory protein